jgi:hypothetical protein
MKINTIHTAFIVNALLAAAISALVLETRLQWKDKQPVPVKTFTLTLIVNLLMFYAFTVVIGNSLGRSMFG